MPTVSLIVELLRARPAAVFWFAALAQGLIWVLVPTLFYASPPGDLPETLAIGHAWQLGSWQGPPLAPWLAELAFNAAGGRAIGVYLLAQLCVVAAFWAMFVLGRAIAGVHQSALAMLLMTGVFAFSAPTPEFGPAVLAMPLTAFALVFLWRALGQGRRNAWIVFGCTLGLLLLASYWGLVFAVVAAAFLPLTREGRAALLTIEPFAAFVLALLISLPHVAWLWETGSLRGLSPLPWLAALALERAAFWPVLVLGIVALHAGLFVLALLASGWRSNRAVPAPEIEGPPRRPVAKRFVYYFAIVLPLVATLIAALASVGGTARWAAPFVLMSALAVVVVAGERIALHRQRIVGVAWLAVLLLPPVALIGALFAGPLTGTFEPETDQPAAAMGRFFADTFRRRVGRPLEIVIGDGRPAALVALASPTRPRLASAVAPQRTPWLSEIDVRAKGAIVVWEIFDPAGRPPEAVRARFPDLVAEVPQSFPRATQGFLPALRIGWGLIRPQAGAAAP